MNITGVFPWMTNEPETGLILPKPARTPSPTTVNGEGLRTVVTISDAGRQLAEADAARKSAETESAKELRNILKQYDFHNMSPNEMSALGGMLFMRGEISGNVAGSFIGVEKEFC